MLLDIEPGIFDVSFCAGIVIDERDLFHSTLTFL